MSRAEWTLVAKADLAEPDGHSVNMSVDHAARLGEAALRAGRLLAERPGAGSLLSAGTRKWCVRGGDLILIYRQVPRGVEILRLRHARDDRHAEP